MRAYLAILKDAFRESLASRVLVFAVIAELLLLILLAPTGLPLNERSQFDRQDFVNVDRFGRLLTGEHTSESAISSDTNPDTDTETGAASGTENPDATDIDRQLSGPRSSELVSRIVSLIDEARLERLQDELEPRIDESTGEEIPRFSNNRAARRLTDALNDLLTSEELYDEIVWADADLQDDTREQLAATDVSNSRSLARRNLLLLRDAFPREIRIIEQNEVSLTYAGFEVARSLGLTPSQLPMAVDLVLAGTANIVLGFFGLLVAIVVTAGIIPRTFESGEIALLLSKPVSRWALYVTRFLGGCTFILILAAVLIGGFWFLLGIRIGVWKHQLLWCIPLMVFLFAILYSVSALLGAVWRNAIVAVIGTVIFWFGLTVVTFVHGLFSELAVKAQQIREIVPAGEQLFAVTGERKTYRWGTAAEPEAPEAEESESDPAAPAAEEDNPLPHDSGVFAAKGNNDAPDWQEVFRPLESQRGPSFGNRIQESGLPFRPVYDKAGNQIWALQPSASLMGIGPSRLVVASEESTWDRVDQGFVPAEAVDLFAMRDGTVLICGRNKVFRYASGADKEKAAAAWWRQNTFGLVNPSVKESFVELTWPGKNDPAKEYAVAADPDSRDLYYMSEGRITRYSASADGSEYSVAAEFSLTDAADETGNTPTGLLTVSGSFLTVATSEAEILLLNKETLEVRLRTETPDGDLPRTVTSTPYSEADSPSFSAVLTHSGRLSLFDTSDGRRSDWVPPEDGRCSAAAFDSEGRLMVAARRADVLAYTIGESVPAESYNKQDSTAFRIFEYIINPVYQVLPRPSGMSDLVTWVLTGEASETTDNQGPFQTSIGRRELLRERRSKDIAGTIRSNLIFILVMLAVGSIYLTRKDM